MYACVCVYTRRFRHRHHIAKQLRDRISVAAYRRRETAPIYIAHHGVCVDFWAHPVYARGWIVSIEHGHPVSRPYVPMRVYLPIPGH